MRRRVLGFTVAMVRARYGGAMPELRLFALSINDVRDIFGADPALASRLRASAAAHFAPPEPSRSLLGRIGPLLTRNKAVEVDPRQPLAQDVEVLLSGGHVPPERLVPCWALMRCWLQELSATSLTLSIPDLDRVEFDLALAGLPSDFSLRQLAERELGIALRPLPGHLVGYSKHLHAISTGRHLHRVLDEAPDRHGSLRCVDPLLEMLDDISRRTGTPLDVVVVQGPGPAG